MLAASAPRTLSLLLLVAFLQPDGSAASFAVIHPRRSRLCNKHYYYYSTHADEGAAAGDEGVVVVVTTTKTNGGVVSRSSFLASSIAAVPFLSTAAAAAAENSIGDSTTSRGRRRLIPSLSTSSPSSSTSPTTPDFGRTLQESLSGMVAGSALAVTKTVVKYPLDTATVRLQMPNSEYSVRRPFQLLDGSYRGIAIPLLNNIPAGAVFFAVKDAFKAILNNDDRGIILSSPLMQTSIAVLAAQVPYWWVRNPAEVVKTKQQANLEGFGEGVTTLEAYQKVAAQGNSTLPSLVDSFYVGYWENVLYSYPADVIKFLFYDSFSRSQGRGKSTAAQAALFGAASTAAAQFMTTPLDVVRNRVMAAAGEQDDDDYVQALVQLAKTEGLPGLFAGWSPRVGKALLSGAIQFATYEETKEQLLKRFATK